MVSLAVLFQNLEMCIAGVTLIEVFFDFHNVKIVQQLSGLLTLLCINVDHFNLFFIYLGKYTYSLEIFELNHFICQESVITDHLRGMYTACSSEERRDVFF